ncbi:MAG: acriflavin resistance protein [Bryobacterales bacterium]|nr:acriflavin resistance protein [Bryobacterales bacterium]
MRMLPALLLTTALAAQDPQSPQLPPARTLEIPARIGILTSTPISLNYVIQRVLANDKDLEVSRIAREEAVYNVRGAQGYFDPRVGLNAHRSHVTTPVASVLGGAPNGKLVQDEWLADPQLSGAFPALGGAYKLDFSSSRQTTNSQFATLSPQFPTSVNLNLTQPLWRGLHYDDNRHRLQVARKNTELTEAQFRQRVIEITTQAIQSYWELDYAYRNLQVQVEAVRLAEQQDASNRRQVAQALLAPIDVIQTQTQIATFEQNVFAAQQLLSTAENAVKILMLPDRNDLMWSAALVPDSHTQDARPALPTLDEAMKHAFEGRPELAQSMLSIQINQFDAKLSREQAKPQIDAIATLSATGLAGTQLSSQSNSFASAFGPLVDRLSTLSALAGLPSVPQINLGGGQIPPIFVGGYGQSLSALGAGNFPSATIGVQISLPVRNRTALAQVAISSAEGRRLKALQQQLEMAVQQDVRNALQIASSAQAQLDAAVDARRYAEQQYASEQRQFLAGTSTVFLVLQRQTSLIGARTGEIRARANLSEAGANVDRAAARTIEVLGISVQ